MDLEYTLEHYHSEPMDEEVSLTIKVQGPYAKVLLLLGETRQTFLDIKYGEGA